ncbi:hypothetical protein A2U01_0111903, partial [Trifolium medium]|nr:hypothetical protein [Trifolium medium]
MDAVFSHMPVAAVIAAVFAPIHIRLNGQLLWESNARLLEIGT